MNTALVIAAHPDDEVLGGGATFAKHADKGEEVHALILTEGATSRYSAHMAGTLRSNAGQSADLIGFSSIRFEELPDQKLDQVPILEVTQLLESVIRSVRPTTIYTHSQVDVNTDHGIVAQATWTASRPYSAPWVRQLFAFETPSSTEWAWPMTGFAFQPNWFVDVESTLIRKLDAMSCYESELREYPHPRSLRALGERAAYWGSVAGFAAAEPFVLLRARS